jgi:hypothetical protein
MTNSQAVDGRIDRGAAIVRLGGGRSSDRRCEIEEGAQMKYALLAYSSGERRPTDEIHPMIAAVLDRPEVTGWLRLQPSESATTVTLEARKTLLTDGPFVDSKEFLAGLILVEADNLDGALAVAAELQEVATAAAIEVRPVLEQELSGA